jgi:hypothetical protein
MNVYDWFFILGPFAFFIYAAISTYYEKDA